MIIQKKLKLKEAIVDGYRRSIEEPLGEDSQQVG